MLRSITLSNSPREAALDCAADAAEARAAAAGVPYEAKLAQGDVTTTILATATEQQCDVIILGSLGLTGFKRLMLGSTSNAVSATAPIPVLIVKRFLLT